MYRDELHNKISTEDWIKLTNGKMFYWHNGIIGSVLHKTHLRDYEIVMCDSPCLIDMDDYLMNGIQEWDIKNVKTKKDKKHKKSKKKSKKHSKEKIIVDSNDLEFNQEVNFVRKEVRRDPEDDNLYTKEEFKDYYGGFTEWNALENETKQYIFFIDQ